MVVNNAEKVIFDVESFAEVGELGGKLGDFLWFCYGVAIAENLLYLLFCFVIAAVGGDAVFGGVIIDNSDLVGFFEYLANFVVFGTSIGNGDITL